jgi:hypothetical protein
MTEITTATTKAKTTKHAASSLIPNFEMPKFDMSNMEMPEAFRELTEKGIAHAKDTYVKAKVASEEAADLLCGRCQGCHRLQSQAVRDCAYQHSRRL